MSAQKNIRGVSMLELTIAGAVLGVVVLSMAKLFAFFSTSERHVASVNDWGNTMNSVRQLVSNGTNCKNAFRNGAAAATFNAGTTPGSTLTAIAMNNGTIPILSVGQKIGGYTVSGMNLTKVAGPAGVAGSAPAQQQYLVQLNVTATGAAKTMEQAGRSSSLLINLYAYAGAAPQTIVTCSSVDDGPPTISQQDFCGEIIGGVWNSTTSKCTVVMEPRTSDPASPAQGQMWLRTDL